MFYRYTIFASNVWCVKSYFALLTFVVTTQVSFFIFYEKRATTATLSSRNTGGK
jgi:maltodextrin utilization protein YvdJ